MTFTSHNVYHTKEGLKVLIAESIDYRTSDGTLLRKVIDNQKTIATALSLILEYIEFKESK